MRLGPVTILTKETKHRQKNSQHVMSENCDVFTIFPIYGQFGAIWKPSPDA